MKINWRISGALLATVTLLGCKETTSSEFIRTGGIAALMSVGAESSDLSTVHVELRVGGAQSNTYVILDNGDRLTATVDGETKDLHSVAEGVYEVEFNTAAQNEYVVSLDREEDEDAPDSKATLPAAFSIAQPQPSDELSRVDDGLFIVWTPVADTEGTISLSGSCIQAESLSVAGSAGMLVVNKGTLKSTDEKTPESCSVEISMTFTKEGAADPAYDEESYFRASQSRRTSFTSNP